VRTGRQISSLVASDDEPSVCDSSTAHENLPFGHDLIRWGRRKCLLAQSRTGVRSRPRFPEDGFVRGPLGIVELSLRADAGHFTSKSGLANEAVLALDS
jgi:hypothetical protein